MAPTLSTSTVAAPEGLRQLLVPRERPPELVARRKAHRNRSLRRRRSRGRRGAGRARLIVATGAPSVAWAPNGRWIALADSGSAIVRPDGSGYRRISAHGAGAPSWAPDSRALAVAEAAGGADIWIIAVDGSGERALTDGGRYGYENSQPEWNPRGLSTARLAGSPVSRPIPLTLWSRATCFAAEADHPDLGRRLARSGRERKRRRLRRQGRSLGCRSRTSHAGSPSRTTLGATPASSRTPSDLQAGGSRRP